ncbi:type II secretion system protein [Alicyclobacillus vulcanalis]|uniref:Prepilin-type N-terminal cleavage/methylation domain-containing protein n=1 Tax=Alicyclobacillus vulcanalis TaxID=252246 RepID=A0A1N7KPH8_9BACL|nr:type II secretion system protein [Alicyclobacillus vulcanalis]SIS63519.1 prepilin-type N-terminal cleavage/methylation domain-containing protein [Alicyclobacillus vulcanalis]
MPSAASSHDIHQKGGEGFTLLEVMIVMALATTCFLGIAGAMVSIERAMALRATASTLVAQLRAMQNLAATSDTYAEVWLDPYDTGYRLIQGTQTLASQQFAAGIHYVDGYLQLPVHVISYDNLGNAQAAGVIRLTDGHHEDDIRLYMGAGWQTGGWEG